MNAESPTPSVGASVSEIAREAARRMCDDNFTKGDEKHVLPYIKDAIQSAVVTLQAELERVRSTYIETIADLRARLATAEADTKRLDWMESQVRDYGSNEGWSSVSATRIWQVRKSGHEGTLREAIDVAAQAKDDRK